MASFVRKHNRLSRPAYIGRRWYFVTLCTGKRHPLLCDGVLVNCLLEILSVVSSAHRFDVHAYCFMPDHLHLELAGLSESSELSALMRDFKGKSATAARRMWIRGLWQTSYYDHILREGENEKAVAWYIFNNPVRKGWVKDPREWPFTGSWIFDWTETCAPPEEFVPGWKWRDKPAATQP